MLSEMVLQGKGKEEVREHQVVINPHYEHPTTQPDNGSETV